MGSSEFKMKFRSRHEWRVDDSLRLAKSFFLLFSSRHLKSTWTPSLRFLFLGTHVAKWEKFHIYTRRNRYVCSPMWFHLRCDIVSWTIFFHKERTGMREIWNFFFVYFTFFPLLFDVLEKLNLLYKEKILLSHSRQWSVLLI